MNPLEFKCGRCGAGPKTACVEDDGMFGFETCPHPDRIAEAALAERDRLRSDLSAALVSVDAMAKRLEQLQPIVSVLGDWDWAAIGADVDEVGTAHLIDDRALMAVIKALAHTAREQAKGEE